MGQGSSRVLFIHMLQNMLQARGAKVGHQQLDRFLDLIEKVCPWFPEEGTVNLETWKKVGERLQSYYGDQGPSKVPVDTFGLWTLIRDSLDPRHECLRGNSNPEQNESKTPSAPRISEALEVSVTKDPDNDPDDTLDPGDEEELEEEAARDHEDDVRRVTAVVQQNDASKSPDLKLLENEVQRLQNAFTSLAVQMQQVQARQAAQKQLEEPSEWVPKLSASCTKHHRLGSPSPGSPSGLCENPCYSYGTAISRAHVVSFTICLAGGH